MGLFDTLETSRLKTLAESAARTTSSNSDDFEGFWEANKLRVQLDVTAASGTSPTLDVVIQDTLDGTNYNDIITFTQRTAAGREVINLTTPFSDKVRVKWTLAGTSPSFTFSVVAYVER